MKRVVVRWLDIVGDDGGWLTLAEAKEYRPSLVETHGWILEENESYILVASTLSIGGSGDEDTVGGVHAIPRGVLVAVKEMAERES